MPKEKILICIAVAAVLAVSAAVLAARFSKVRVRDGNSVSGSYTQISQDEAKRMMQEETCIVVDVRRPDEFAAGHIPGAVCIPNETIGTQPPDGLADKAQTILVYCRSGNRSKQAAQKLFDMGYSHVFEFGGILDWTGETVTGNQ